MSPSERGAVVVSPVMAADLPDFVAAMEALSSELGDEYRATAGRLSGALFGPRAVSMAYLSRAGSAVAGAAFAHPYFSTVLGSAGVYVSDLWVAPCHRGAGIGRALLSACARDGAARWDARFLKLSVYADAPGAIDFYERLGFKVQERDRPAILTGAALEALTDGDTA